jgi:hypothetical protein
MYLLVGVLLAVFMLKTFTVMISLHCIILSCAKNRLNLTSGYNKYF